MTWMLKSGFHLKLGNVVLLPGAECVLALGKITPVLFTAFAGQILGWRKKRGIPFMSGGLQMAHHSLQHKLN